MALISQRESNINSISFYKISALCSPADLDRWFSSVLLPADLTIRRVLLENSAGRTSEGDGTMDISPESARKGLSGCLRQHGADYIYIHVTYRNANLTIGIHAEEWTISLVGKKRFSSQSRALADSLGLNED